MKISLALIVAPTEKEAKRLDACLKTAVGFFDEICITQAGPHPAIEVSEVIEKHKAKESFFKWTGNFAEARSYNFKQCTGDWIMWLDSDDLLRGGQNVRKNVELADEHGVTGLSTLYHYAHDAKGNLTDSHWKLQIVKNGYYEWKGVIHEDLLPLKETKNASIKDVVRVHTATEKDQESSLIRNLSILKKAMENEPEEPRHYFYAARCYLGVEDWQSVIEVVDKYLTLSDWKEERYDALNMAGEAHMRLGEYDEAIKTHHKAILELEDAPDAYIFKARNYLQKEEWINALTCLEIASQRDQDAVVLKRSALYDHDMLLMTAVAFNQIGEYQKALNAAQKAYDNRKSSKAEELVKLGEHLVKNEELTKLYRKLGETLLDQPEHLQSLLETVPADIKDDPRLLRLAFSANPPKKWADNSIVWFCGGSLETWDGNSIKNGGIGGSETAVIELAKRQAAAGYEVTVFNHCGAPADGNVIDGVTYRNYWQYNKLDEFNTIILWRTPQFVDIVNKANKIIVDMHDVSSPIYFTEERLKRIDAVHVKTNYHKSLYPNVPEEKFVVVGNGIDLTRFEKEEKKNPYRFIYTSSANRGLENILDVWPEIKEKVPQAELHVFYGWNTFVEAHKNDPAKMQWVDLMKQKLQQDGITNHGRVDQITLAQEMQKSSLWLYPTSFSEIHCITSLEMQAAKVYPITTGFAALAETQKSGVKIEGDPKTDAWRQKFIAEIVNAVENPDLLESDIAKGREYAELCSWDNVVDSWM